MTKFKGIDGRLGRAAAWAVLTGCTPVLQAGTAAPPPTADPQQQLLSEVRALRDEVNELKAERLADRAHGAAAGASSTGLSGSSDPVGPLVTPAAQQTTTAAVENDAQAHSYLFGDVDGFTAGYANNRFVIQSTDGNFAFRPWLHFQFRDVTNDRQNFKTDGTGDLENGFEVRRMRFGVDGNLFSPDLTYFFNWATVRANGNATVSSGGRSVGTVSNNLGGAPLLEEAWVRDRLHDTPFSFRLGQFKDPVLHDQIVSSRYQQSTERSLTADIFTNGDDFTEGATFIIDNDTWWRTETGVNHGMRSANTNFNDYPTNAFNWGVVGRAEFKLMGRWRDYGQVGGIGIKQPLLVAGLGGDLSERGHSNQTVAAADVMYVQPNGLNAYGAFVDRYTDHNFGYFTQSATGASITAPPASVLNTATNEYSILGQVGYLINPHWEPFGRFEYMKFQGTPTGSHNYVPAIFGGVNYYFYGQRAKLTGQAVYLPNGIPFDDTPNDVLASPSGVGEFVFIAQFQLLL